MLLFKGKPTRDLIDQPEIKCTDGLKGKAIAVGSLEEAAGGGVDALGRVLRVQANMALEKGGTTMTDRQITSTEIHYPCQGIQVGGYLSRPQAEGSYPALVVIQEWWGITDHMKDVTARLAREGYVALAPDLYHGQVTSQMAEAANLMSTLKRESALADLNGAVDYLKGQPFVRQDRIGVTGFCMGGTYALLLACQNSTIKVSVPFYGEIPSPIDPLAQLNGPLLYLYGEDDARITMDDVNRLREGLKRYNKVGEVKTYPGAPHAFFNDTRPEVYRPEAARDAWQRTLAFLGKHLSSLP